MRWYFLPSKWMEWRAASKQLIKRKRWRRYEKWTTRSFELNGNGRARCMHTANTHTSQHDSSIHIKFHIKHNELHEWIKYAIDRMIFNRTRRPGIIGLDIYDEFSTCTFQLEILFCHVWLNRDFSRAPVHARAHTHTSDERTLATRLVQVRSFALFGVCTLHSLPRLNSSFTSLDSSGRHDWNIVCQLFRIYWSVNHVEKYSIRCCFKNGVV